MNNHHDFYIDFLKGFCIICVVLTHNLPSTLQKASVFVAWGAMAVPIFLLIQAYHIFNGDLKRRSTGLPAKSFKDHYDLKKLWKRILKPFFVCLIISGAILIILGHDPVSLLKSITYSGGIGPGSYYVWIYLQFFFLLPLCLTFINKWGGVSLTFLLFVIVSQGLEWLCMYINLPEPIYRLSCFRYVFLIYLGYIWVANDMSKTLTRKQIFLSILSLGVLLLLYYTTGSLKPFLHDSNWRVFHWVCYFYVALLLPWLLRNLYNHLPQKPRKLIEEIGSYSYEIFLIQMMVFTLYPKIMPADLDKPYNWIIFFILTTLLSIVPVVLWKRYKEHIIHLFYKNL